MTLQSVGTRNKENVMRWLKKLLGIRDLDADTSWPRSVKRQAAAVEVKPAPRPPSEPRPIRRAPAPARSSNVVPLDKTYAARLVTPPAAPVRSDSSDPGVDLALIALWGISASSSSAASESPAPAPISSGCGGDFGGGGASASWGDSSSSSSSYDSGSSSSDSSSSSSEY